jgi:glycogen operon protein
MFSWTAPVMRTGDVRHGFVPDVGPGQRHGYRVQGLCDRRRGVRFDLDKLLLDPYARATVGEIRFEPAVFGHGTGDSAPYVPRSRVVPAGPGPGRARDTRWPTSSSARCTSKASPCATPTCHPTYAAPTRGWPTRPRWSTCTLGVIAIELLPVHQNVPEPFLVRRHGT